MTNINDINSLRQTELVGSRQTTKRETLSERQSDIPETQVKRSDTLSLTSQAEQLKRLESLIEQSPAIDSERVSTLKTAVEKGVYQIDAENLARNLIGFELSLKQKD